MIDLAAALALAKLRRKHGYPDLTIKQKPLNKSREQERRRKQQERANGKR